MIRICGGKPKKRPGRRLPLPGLVFQVFILREEEE